MCELKQSVDSSSGLERYFVHNPGNGFVNYFYGDNLICKVN